MAKSKNGSATSEITIDKNVPVPKARNARHYPLTELAVGDSFFVPELIPSAIYGYITYAKRMTGRKFTARTVEGGCRVWRTE